MVMFYLINVGISHWNYSYSVPLFITKLQSACEHCKEIFKQSLYMAVKYGRRVKWTISNDIQLETADAKEL
jgi:hypothetical protein